MAFSLVKLHLASMLLRGTVVATGYAGHREKQIWQGSVTLQDFKQLPFTQQMV